MQQSWNECHPGRIHWLSFQFRCIALKYGCYKSDSIFAEALTILIQGNWNSNNNWHKQIRSGEPKTQTTTVRLRLQQLGALQAESVIADSANDGLTTVYSSQLSVPTVWLESYSSQLLVPAVRLEICSSQLSVPPPHIKWWSASNKNTYIHMHQ